MTPFIPVIQPLSRRLHPAPEDFPEITRIPAFNTWRKTRSRFKVWATVSLVAFHLIAVPLTFDFTQSGIHLHQNTALAEDGGDGGDGGGGGGGGGGRGGW